MANRRKSSIMIGFIVAVVAFFLIFIGIYKVLASKITLKNIIAYFVLAIILGVVSAIFYYYKFMIAFWIFLIGEIIGFYQMYRGFIDGMDGWGDLVGIISLLTWIVLAFITGLAINVCIYLYKKYMDRD